MLVFIILCSYPTSWICELGGRATLFQPLLDVGVNVLKRVAVDVLIHVVQFTILEAVYSDILTHFAGNEYALFSVRTAYCYSQSLQLHET